MWWKLSFWAQQSTYEKSFAPWKAKNDFALLYRITVTGVSLGSLVPRVLKVHKVRFLGFQRNYAVVCSDNVRVILGAAGAMSFGTWRLGLSKDNILNVSCRRSRVLLLSQEATDPSHYLYFSLCYMQKKRFITHFVLLRQRTTIIKREHLFIV